MDDFLTSLTKGKFKGKQINECEQVILKTINFWLTFTTIDDIVERVTAKLFEHVPKTVDSDE